MVDYLIDFVRESNRIEGILRDPTDDEIAATAELIGVERLVLTDLCCFVSIVQPGAELRERPGMNVRVGNHVPPRGGPGIKTELVSLLEGAEHNFKNPWVMHCRYETLHPFMDGNGRSGRAIWAWQMVRQGDDLSLGFLRRFYYQTLERSAR